MIKSEFIFKWRLRWLFRCLDEKRSAQVNPLTSRRNKLYVLQAVKPNISISALTLDREW